MTIPERNVYLTGNPTTYIAFQSLQMEEPFPQKDMSATMYNPKLNLSNTTINTPPEVDTTTTSTPYDVDTTAKDNPVSFITKYSPQKKSIITFLFAIGTVLMMCSQPSFAAEPYFGGNFVLINIDEIARVLRDTGQDRFTIRTENGSIVINVTVRAHHTTVNNSDVNTGSAAADLHDDDDDDDDGDDGDGSGSYRVRNNDSYENVATEDNQVTDSNIMDGYAAILESLPQTVNEHLNNRSIIRPTDMNSSFAINGADDTRSDICHFEKTFEEEAYNETIQRSLPNHQLVVSNQPIGSENPNLIAGHAINNNVSEEMEESSTSERGLLVISGRQSLSNSSGSDASSYCPSPTESAISRYHASFSRSAGVSVLPNEVSKPIISEEGHQQMDHRHQTLISGNRESTALQLYGSDHQFSENIESPIEDTTDSPGVMVITGQTLAIDDRDAIYRVLGERPQARTAVTLYHPTNDDDGENGNHGELVVTERYRQPLRPAVGHQLLVTPHNPGTDPRCPINQPARLATMAVSGSSQLSNPVISPVPSDRIMAANTNDTAVHQDNGSDIDI